MYCPKCGAEFIEGITVCDDCNVSLVPEPPSPIENEFIEFEEILETSNPGDIAIIKSILGGSDIDFYFNGDFSMDILYHAIPAKLMVSKDQVEEAVELLKDLNINFPVKY
ncbi:MAG: DUF2007 domain-containing protein [Candidatus Schekmanbacteria bacterium]|nr:DUF2007 domain-containing protein [Candidatus Schekmanbacteria bacterium]